VEAFDYGLNAAATDFDGVNKYIRITDIDDESREFKSDNVTSPDCDISASENYKLQDGDILFARTGASVGKTYRYAINDGFVYFAGFLIRARVKSDFDTDFVYQYTFTKKYNEFIKIMSQRSGQPGVNAQEYAGFSIWNPCSEEQAQIGKLFSTLDDTIAIYKRKLDGLRKLKKAYLQVMFPQAGETVPKVRFEGFDGAWEENALGEMADIMSGITGDTTIYSGNYRLTRIETISSGTVDMQRLGFTNTKPELRYKLNRGDVLYSNINSIEHIGKVARFDEEEDVYHGINLLRLSPKLVESYFLYTYFLTQQVINWAKSRANKAVSQASINQTTLSCQRFRVPNRDEQKAIGNFFYSVDKQVVAHSEKLELLNKLKSAYLQKMFI